MKRRLLGLGVLGIGMSGLVFGDAACHSATTDDIAQSQVASTDAGDTPIVIGANIALTGAGGPYGQAEQSAVKYTETLINSFGGLLDRPVRFEIRDDASDTPTSTRNMSDFIAAKVPVILGPTLSAQLTPTTAQAATEQSQAHDGKVILLSSSASTPVTRDAEPPVERFFFRTAASHSYQAKALALRMHYGFAPGGASDAGADAGKAAGTCSKVAVIHTDDSYGTPIAQAFATQLQSLGGNVVADVKLPSTQKANYDTEAAQVIAAQPDCQLVITLVAVGVSYMQSFVKATSTNTTRDWGSFISVGANGLYSNQFLVTGRQNQSDPSSPTIGEGMYIMNLDLNPDTPEYREFKNAFLLQYPLAQGQKDLAGYTASQFDAAILTCLAIARAGTATDTTKIRNALYEVSRPPGTAFSPGHIQDALAAIRLGQDIDYDGASGPVDFDDYGEVISGYVVYKISNGAYQLRSDLNIKVDDLK